jgi:hypothetical protein
VQNTAAALLLRYGIGMTSAPWASPGPRSSGLSDAPPAVVRAALLPEDVARFDEQWRAAMAAATDSLDLTEVFLLLESWRRVARLTVGLGPDGYRRMLDDAEERLNTGAMPADPVSAEQVRFRLAARIAAGPR